MGVAGNDSTRAWTVARSEKADEVAPDGAEVRVLGRLEGISTMEFLLAGGRVSNAVRHRTVDEVWYVLGGNGDLWRSGDGAGSVTELRPGTSVAIPLGTAFQFRAHEPGPLRIHAATVPPWPGQSEGEVVAGPWQPDLQA
jgi:mannose-6-phosphate isomerase-like protein (cupin superfamily)